MSDLNEEQLATLKKLAIPPEDYAVLFLLPDLQNLDRVLHQPLERRGRADLSTVQRRQIIMQVLRHHPVISAQSL